MPTHLPIVEEETINEEKHEQKLPTSCLQWFLVFFFAYILNMYGYTHTPYIQMYIHMYMYICIHIYHTYKYISTTYIYIIIYYYIYTINVVF